MRYHTLTQRFQADTAVHDLVTGVIDTINAAEDGQDVDLAFLKKQKVGEFCQALGFAAGRSWALLKLDEIAPTGEENVRVVPEGDLGHLWELRYALARKHLQARISEKLDRA